MSAWFTSNLGDAMLAGESLDHIRALFMATDESAGGSKDRAVFIRHESEGRLHCEVKIYFSPAAADVAKAVGAEVCKKPSPVGLGLLAGAEESLAVLFPC